MRKEKIMLKTTSDHSCQVCGCELVVPDWVEYHGENAYCEECALRENYNFQTALKYIESNNLEKEFYVEWVYETDVREASLSLLSLCMNGFREFTEQLQSKLLYEFITYDIGHFLDWLNVGDYYYAL